jgi:hypothetical protein
MTKKINFYSVIEYFCENLDKKFLRRIENDELILEGYANSHEGYYTEGAATLAIEFLCDCGTIHDFSIKSVRF